jgi:uncharacterized spore protein YtfJ
MIETADSVASIAEQATTQNEKIIDKIYAAAQPDAVFSAPFVSGEYTIITAREVGAGGGFGFGVGTAPAEAKSNGVVADPKHSTAGGAGGGGGGGSMGRPIAAIVIGPDGVKVKPIVDTTKVALAAIGAWSAVALMSARVSRAKKG